MRYKFYKTKFKRLSPNDIFVMILPVFIACKQGRVMVYCPIGQHSEADINYILDSCKEITKAKYIEVSDGLYTPEEYLL